MLESFIHVAHWADRVNAPLATIKCVLKENVHCESVIHMLFKMLSFSANAQQIVRQTKRSVNFEQTMCRHILSNHDCFFKENNALYDLQFGYLYIVRL